LFHFAREDIIRKDIRKSGPRKRAFKFFYKSWYLKHGNCSNFIVCLFWHSSNLLQ
jgi:hypothetical protein